jgi:hypothetical protein
MGSGSASRIDDPNAAKTYRLEFAYAFVRRESEQNSSLQLLQVCGSRRKTAPIISRWTERADALTAVGLRSDGYVSINFSQNLRGTNRGAEADNWVVGDVLLVTRLDRLARSTRDLLNMLDAVGKAGAGFRSLADNWAVTTPPHGRLTVTVLGGLAEFERELIKARTAEGRIGAKARGVRLGRKLKLSRHQILEALARREAGEALTEIGRTFGVSHSTISRLRDWLPRNGLAEGSQ